MPCNSCDYGMMWPAINCLDWSAISKSRDPALRPAAL